MTSPVGQARPAGERHMARCAVSVAEPMLEAETLLALIGLLMELSSPRTCCRHVGVNQPAVDRAIGCRRVARVTDRSRVPLWRIVAIRWRAPFSTRLGKALRC